MTRALRFVMLTVGLWVAGVAWGQGTASYVVQPGDTLYRIALTHGSTVAELTRLNKLADPSRIEVGQVLLLPRTFALPATLPPPITNVSVAPEVPTQGRTITLTVELDTSAPVQASFLGLDYTLAPIASGARGVLAIPVLQEPGVYTLTITANPDTSDEVTLSAPVRVADAGYEREAITLPPSSNDLYQNGPIRDELGYVRSHCRAFEPTQRWVGTFRYPIATPTFTSLFGTLRSFNGGPYNSYHEGLDFRGNSSTPVYAAADGIAVIAETLTVRGNAVYLQHGWGVCSGYMHLSQLAVEPGEHVKQGDLLGYVGGTGLVTGPHLHWEVRVNGIPVDPGQWVEARVGLD